jgi:hypothetical protein
MPEAEPVAGPKMPIRRFPIPEGQRPETCKSPSIDIFLVIRGFIVEARFFPSCCCADYK